MSFGTEKLLKLMRNIGRTIQMLDNEIDLEEWVIALLNDISDASKYRESYELTLSKERVRKIAEAWETITNVELS